MEKCNLTLDPDWSGLYGDVLACIMDKLILGDYVRCGAVCNSWRSVFIEGIDKKKTCHSVPRLLIPPVKALTVEEEEEEEDDEPYSKRLKQEEVEEEKEEKLEDGAVEEEEEEEDDEPYSKRLKQEEVEEEKEEKLEDGDDRQNNSDQTRSLYCLLQKRVSDVRVEVPHDKYCIGSCFGWLITMQKVDINRYSLELRNPFLSNTNIINLPSLDDIVELDDITIKYQFHYIDKAVLSANPLFENYFVVMAIVFGRLAYFKPGNKAWTPIEWGGEQQPVNDVIFYNKAQKFYAVLRGTGAVLAVDLEVGDNQRPKTKQVAPPNENPGASRRYLVESSCGDLLQVYKYGTGYYGVFKMDSVTGGWLKVQNLGENALFLGPNSSLYLSVSDIAGCKPNCIYYTKEWLWDNNLGEYDLKENGVFNLEDRSTEPHYPLDSNTFSSGPIWIEPT